MPPYSSGSCHFSMRKKDRACKVDGFQIASGKRATIELEYRLFTIFTTVPLLMRYISTHLAFESFCICV